MNETERVYFQQLQQAIENGHDIETAGKLFVNVVQAYALRDAAKILNNNQISNWLFDRADTIERGDN